MNKTLVVIILWGITFTTHQNKVKLTWNTLNMTMFKKLLSKKMKKM